MSSATSGTAGQGAECHDDDRATSGRFRHQGRVRTRRSGCSSGRRDDVRHLHQACPRLCAASRPGRLEEALGDRSAAQTGRRGLGPPRLPELSRSAAWRAISPAPSAPTQPHLSHRGTGDVRGSTGSERTTGGTSRPRPAELGTARSIPGAALVARGTSPRASRGVRGATYTPCQVRT